MRDTPADSRVLHAQHEGASPHGAPAARELRLGGCQCGAIRYAVSAVLQPGTICHCSQCRAATGAPMVAWFSAGATSVALTAGQVASFRSSEHAVRSFCSSCGTALFFQEDGQDEIDITVCSLDDPTALAPQDHTFVHAKVSWVALTDGLPQHARTRAEGALPEPLA